MPTHEPDLWFSFVRTHRRMIREVERRLAEAGLPGYAWYDTLWALETGPDGARRMHELADALAVERYNLTRLVDRLEQEGLVTRARSPEDGRAAFASITKEGRALRKKMWKVYETTVSELFVSQFSPNERADFASALDRAAAAARDAHQAASSGS